MARLLLDPQIKALTQGEDVIVFDGVCVLCSGFLKFMLRFDRKSNFHFIIAQSELGEALYAQLGLKSTDYDTNIVITGGQLHTKLDAFVAAMMQLGGVWRLAAIVKILPRAVSDWLYDRIARNRYAMFGRTDACMIPTPEIKARFLG